MHDGHRTIRMYSLDWQNLKVTGSETLLVNGGTDMAKTSLDRSAAYF